MLMGAPNWMFQTDLPDDIISNSLKFDRASSAYLVRQNGAATDAQKWTLSVWLKRTGLSSEQGILGSGSTAEYIRFESDDTIRYRLYTSSAQRISMITSAKFRDTTNWYHLVCAVDLSNTTDNDKCIIYVNGTRQALGTNTTTTTDTYDSLMNDNSAYWNVGRYSQYFDGYMADLNIIDGQQLTPTSFAKEVNGVYVPKDTSGLTFGNNGARLQFKQTGTGTASASTIGADTSGNTNHFTSANLVAGDVVTDTPDNNFATMNPLIKSGNTFSEGNLKVTTTTSTPAKFVSTMGVTSGKWFMEFRHSGDANYPFGIASDTQERDYLGLSDGSTSVAIWGGSSNSNAFVNGSQVSWDGSGTTWTAGDIIGLALNATHSILEVYKNGVSVGSYDYSALNWTNHFFAAGNYVAATFSANFGQDDTFAGAVSSNSVTGGGGKFRHAPPAGYMALCSRNLSEPTLSSNPNRPENVNDHFNAYSYTADNTDNKARTGMGFQPDLLWFKDRDTGFSPTIYDSSRGANKYLQSNGTGAENTTSDLMSSFDSDGFTTQNDSSSGNLFNYSSDKYIVWSWKANGATTTTNDASATSVGTIDSVYQANTTAGFSIVTYTGTGSAGSIAHGLGAVPKFIIGKNRGDGGTTWAVYHKESGNGYLELDTTAAYNSGTFGFNNTDPTSSVFTVDASGLGASSKNYIAYLWAEVEGYSKFGTYTGNGNADGTYVHLGFKPALFVAKSTGTENWVVMDNKRPGYNPTGNYLFWNLSNTEGGAGSEYIDLLSNGVKLRTTGASANGSATFIYMAWAESPFKYSNAV